MKRLALLLIALVALSQIAAGPLDVRHREQEHGTLTCGPVCLLMAMDYYHSQDSDCVTVEFDGLLSSMRSAKQFIDTVGTNVYLIEVAAHGYGYYDSRSFQGWTKDDLIAALDLGHLVIATVRLNFGLNSAPHSVLVVGVYNDVVVVNDPWADETAEIPWDLFNLSWYSFESCVDGHGVVIAP